MTKFLITTQRELTERLCGPPCLLGGFGDLKVLCVDPVLFHQSLALVLVQVKVAHRHHTAGRQLDHGGGEIRAKSKDPVYEKLEL